MRLSRPFGILSIVFLLLAILTVALPIYSTATGLRVSSNQQGTGSSQGNVPTSFKVSNNGFLGVDGLFVNVNAFAPNGTQLYSVTVGPLDVPPGATVPVSITLPNISSFTRTNGTVFAGLANVTLKLTARVNLGGLIPISTTADVVVQLGQNGTQEGGQA